MFHAFHFFRTQFGYNIIILLACCAANVHVQKYTSQSNVSGYFPIQPSEDSSSSDIKIHQSFASSNVQTSTIGSASSDAGKVVYSNTETPKSDFRPAITTSTSTKGFLPSVANIVGGSAYTNSASTSSNLESARSFSEDVNSTTADTTSTLSKLCSKLSPSRNSNAVQLNPSSSAYTVRPNQELKINAFAEAALSTPAVQKYLNYKISGLEAAVIFFNHTYNALRYLRAPNFASNANDIAKAVATIDVLSVPLYFQVTGNAIERILLLEGIDMLPLFPQNYASIVENTLLSFTIDGPKSLYLALLKGFSNFLTSLGFCDGQEADDLAFIYSSEFISLQNSEISF